MRLMQRKSREFHPLWNSRTVVAAGRTSLIPVDFVNDFARSTRNETSSLIPQHAEGHLLGTGAHRAQCDDGEYRLLSSVIGTHDALP